MTFYMHAQQRAHLTTFGRGVLFGTRKTNGAGHLLHKTSRQAGVCLYRGLVVCSKNLLTEQRRSSYHS